MIRTHLNIDHELCGIPVEIRSGYSKVSFVPTKRMVADEMGLVHGGFVFGCADYAAMIAVNHPNVVLASSSVKFLKPVSLGDTLEAEAVVHDASETKKVVSVTLTSRERVVFAGEFICIVLDRHVLDQGK